MPKDKYGVFIVDDSPNDRFFARMTVSRSPKFTVLGEARDGQEVLEYLAGEGVFSDRQKHPLPDVLLLDIKMPRKSGYDVLEWLKEHPRPHLIVIMLSDSALPDDVAKSLELGADEHFRKTSVRQENDAMILKIELLTETDSHVS